jgi:hypothetical protein
MKWVIGTAVTWNGTNISDGRTTPTVPAAAVGKVSSLYNTTLQSACMTNQAWNPQITNLSLTNPTAGSTTGLKADGLLGEEKDNGNKPISTAAYAFTQLPPFVGINANAFGAGLDQCAVETFVNPAGSGGERFDITVDRDPAVPGIQPACPPQAIMGTAYVDSPLIDTQLIGDIYFVIGSPIPNIGVRIAPDVEDPRWRAANEAGGANPYKRFPNPQGVNVGIVGRTGVDNYIGNEWYPKVGGIDPDTGDPLPTTWHFGDCVPGGGQTCNAGVMLTISSLADVPISNLKLDIGDRKPAWRPRNDASGNLEQNSLVVSGCADPTFPWTELDASSNPVRIGPPLNLNISPWGKVVNSLGIADLPIQTNLSRKFQPIQGCPPGAVHQEGDLYNP